ncbi:preprotein translocase subunit SecG [Mycoplasma todarodis]|uniref:Protein-export membrane protein SecG n=1 Tax=Mycoplasma todarodis TaxID=1937191 RepID=A0A4R0XKI4_9MOLU|nr:preprotein translocase subunit SecG [Mycoplasma todarodis]TCG11166.1 preprotein translocase subunit SecG [Mycoplasma todarodis]
MLGILITLLVLSFVVIGLSLLMSGDSQGFSGALVGSSDLDLFKVSKERGGKKILKRVMFGLGILLMIGAIIVRVYM